MFSQFDKVLRTPFTATLLLINVLRQKRFIKTRISPELEPYRNLNDSSLNDKDFTKITEYYGFGVPAVLGEAICALRGKKMSADERMASTAQGVITGLFDDFFDEWGLENTKVIALVNHPEEYQAENDNQKLFIQFYIKSLNLCQYPQSVRSSLTDVFHAQVDSLKQAKKELLDMEEIKRITFKK
jgi:hypothetical protein